MPATCWGATSALCCRVSCGPSLGPTSALCRGVSVEVQSSYSACRASFAAVGAQWVGRALSAPRRAEGDAATVEPLRAAAVLRRVQRGVHRVRVRRHTGVPLAQGHWQAARGPPRALRDRQLLLVEPDQLPDGCQVSKGSACGWRSGDQRGCWGLEVRSARAALGVCSEPRWLAFSPRAFLHTFSPGSVSRMSCCHAIFGAESLLT